MRTLRITTRGWSTLVVSGAVGAIGRLLGSLELLCAGLAGAFAFLFALVAATFSHRPRLALQRRVPGAVFADDVIRVHLTAAAGGRRTPMLTIDEATIGAAHRTFGLAPMRPDAQRALEYTVAVGGRGVRLLGPCNVTQSDPFGFTQRTMVAIEPVRVVVWPQPVMAERPDIDARAETLPPSVRTHGFDRDLGDLRRFVDGDELRRVHWRTTARTGQLMVRTDSVTSERARPLIVLDARGAAHTAGSFELALSVVCGYALDGSYAPRVIVATDAGSRSYVEARELLAALADLPEVSVAGRSESPIDRLVLDLPTGPDLLVAGPGTVAAGVLARASAVLRCPADGHAPTFTRPLGAR